MKEQDSQPASPARDKHKLSIGLPIGGTIGAIGLILLLYGLFSSPAEYQRSLGINVNLWWGLLMVVFGAVMIGWKYYAAWRRERRSR